MTFSQPRPSVCLFAWCAITAAILAAIAPPAGAQTLDSQQLAFFSLINNYRAQNGAGPLQVSIALQNSSQWMANDLATKNYFSHTDSLGRDPGTRMRAFGYPNASWGENIAAGYSDAQNTLNQWITACDADSSGNCTYAHRQNMLNPIYKVMGIGRANSATSTYGWYWVTDFGSVVDPTLNLGSGGGSDTQAPTAPVITSSAARSATEVDLTWSASADNVGVAGYQIIRNGAVLTSVSGSTLSFADKGVSGGTTYSYMVKAFDAAGNYSPASNAVQVTTPAAVAAIKLISVQPNSGSGSSQTFAFTVSDSKGYGSITAMQMVIDSTLASYRACYIYFMPGYNVVWLANDVATAWTGPMTLGSSATLQNSQCTVHAAGSKWTGSGNNLTLNLALSFSVTAFGGAKNFYADATDNAGLDTGWQQLSGSWTVK